MPSESISLLHEGIRTIAYETPSDRYAASAGLLESMWRYRWSVLAFVIAFGMAGYTLSLLQSPRYEASASMVLVDPQTGNLFSEGHLSAADIARSTSKKAEYVESTRVLEGAIEQLDGDWTVEDLRDSIQVTARAEIDTVVVTARAGSATEAAEIANTVTESYRAVVRDDGRQRTERAQAALEATSEDLQSAIAEADERLRDDPEDQSALAQLEAAIQQLVSVQTRASETAVNAALSDDGLEFVEPAVAPQVRSAPRPLRNAVAAALLAFLLAGPLSWMRADRDRLLIHPEDPARVLGSPLLGEIPKARLDERAALHSPRAMPLAAYDVVAVNIKHLVDSAVILVTSARPGDGKTVTAMNLAAALVREDRRVVLVDGDARKRGLTQMLEVDPMHPGLTDLARGTARPDQCELDIEFAGSRLLFVPSGVATPDLGPLFRSAGMRDTIERLSRQCDTMIIDSPPVLAGSDTASLADTATAVLVVVRRRTPTGLLDRARQSLAMVKAPIVGYLFTQNASRQMEYYGGQLSDDAPEDRRSTVMSSSSDLRQRVARGLSSRLRQRSPEREDEAEDVSEPEPSPTDTVR